MRIPPRSIRGTRWMVAAAVAGIVHAAFSPFWAAGGIWLLPTVGQWAVDAAEHGGMLAGGILAGIGLVKLVAALAPVLAERHAGKRLRRIIRGISWVGGARLGVISAGPRGFDPGASSPAPRRAAGRAAPRHRRPSRWP